MTRLKFLSGFLLAPIISMAAVFKKKPKYVVTVAEIRAARHMLQARGVEPMSDNYFRCFLSSRVSLFLPAGEDITKEGWSIAGAKTRIIPDTHVYAGVSGKNGTMFLLKERGGKVIARFPEMNKSEF